MVIYTPPVQNTADNCALLPRFNNDSTKKTLCISKTIAASCIAENTTCQWRKGMFCFKQRMWLKVKNIPENHSSWYSSTDRLLGYTETGDSSSDSNMWEMKYVGLPFDKFMFAHQNIRGTSSLPLGADLWLILGRNDVMKEADANESGAEVDIQVSANCSSLNSSSHLVKGVFHNPFFGTSLYTDKPMRIGANESGFSVS